MISIRSKKGTGKERKIIAGIDNTAATNQIAKNENPRLRK